MNKKDRLIYEFVFPEPTPSNNAVMRMHHRERSKEHMRVTWLVRSVIGPRAGKPTIEHCKMRIIRHGFILLDWDNFGGGLKFLNDAMVKTKLIRDDKPACVHRLELDQLRVGKGRQGTIIKIFED